MLHGGSVTSVAVVFAMAGLAMAQTLARVPAIRDQVAASQAELGLALVGGGIGSLLAMPHTSRLVERWGSRRVTAAALLLRCMGWGSVALAPSVWVLAALLVLTGAAVGVWDVAMNIQGNGVERRRRRSLMPLFHAAFSGGAVIGAGLGALAAWRGVGLVQVPVVALLAAVTGVLAVRRFVADDARAPRAGAPGKPAQQAEPPARSRITRAEVLIGVVCLGAALAEGAANDWLALLLVDVRGAPEAFGALA